MSAGAAMPASAYDAPSPEASPSAKQKVIKPLTKKKLEKHLAAAENRGVCYMSRVPPFLKPDTLRKMLSGLGTEVLRIYLAAESGAARAGRVKAGGNRKKSFAEGWIEFEDKRRAKRIASSLNNTPIGHGGNRGFYAHDLWNIEYLHKFKWNDLTEKMAYEKRMQRDKMVAELQAAKKESNFYLRKVEQAKAIDAMEERKRKRNAAAAPDAGAAGAAGGGAGPPTKRARPDVGEPTGGGAQADDALRSVRRTFKQRRVARDPAASEEQAERLGKLLGRKMS